MVKKSTKASKKVSKPKKMKSEITDESYPDKPAFCTQCDKDLDDFWMDKRADNPELVRRNHERCVKSGKFKGDFCAKLFIISSDDFEGAWFRE
jgi:hypothetical protein